VSWLDFADNVTDEFFIGAGDGKFVAGGEEFSALYNDPSDHAALFISHLIYRRAGRVSSRISAEQVWFEITLTPFSLSHTGLRMQRPIVEILCR
jgi:hypothetical protein